MSQKITKEVSPSTWIPVTQRLPRLSQESWEGDTAFSNDVLVRYAEGDTPNLPAAIARLYDDGHWEDENGFSLPVVAWMPIPPFEEEVS